MCHTLWLTFSFCFFNGGNEEDKFGLTFAEFKVKLLKQAMTKDMDLRVFHTEVKVDALA